MEPVCRDLVPFSPKSIGEVSTLMLGDQVRLVLDGVYVRDLYRSVKFFHTKLGKPFLNGAGFVNMSC